MCGHEGAGEARGREKRSWSLALCFLAMRFGCKVNKRQVGPFGGTRYETSTRDVARQRLCKYHHPPAAAVLSHTPPDTPPLKQQQKLGPQLEFSARPSSDDQLTTR